MFPLSLPLAGRFNQSAMAPQPMGLMQLAHQFQQPSPQPGGQWQGAMLAQQLAGMPRADVPAFLASYAASHAQQAAPPMQQPPPSLLQFMQQRFPGFQPGFQSPLGAYAPSQFGMGFNPLLMGLMQPRY